MMVPGEAWFIGGSANAAVLISNVKIARQRVQRDVKPEECRLFNCPTCEHYYNEPSVHET